MGIRADFDKERLSVIEAHQYDVVTRRQLLDCGMTRSAIQHRVGPGGQWQIILPGVYAASAVTVSAKQRQMAALLYAGPQGMITGAFAVRHYGLVASGPDYVDVLVPADLRRKSVRYVHLIRTGRMPAQAYLAEHLRISPLPRAIADAVRGYRTIGDAHTVIGAAVKHNLCTIADLAAELNDGPKRGSALLQRGLHDVAAGIWSAAEGDLMQLIKNSDLPQPEYNVALYTPDGTLLGIVDAWWQRAGVAAEVDSREFHFKEEDWRKTMRRHNRIAKHRVQLLHFPPADITFKGTRVLADLRDAIAAGLAAPPLPIRGERATGLNGAIDTLRAALAGSMVPLTR
jgi:hypothetical protein